MSTKERVSAQETLSAAERLIQSRPEIAGFQAYEYLDNNNASQIDAFIEGSRDSLDLSYTRLDDPTLEEMAVRNREALVLIMGGEGTEKTNALYRALEYRYAEMYLIRLARDMQSTQDSVSRAETTREFQLVSEALYGKPEPTVFHALAQRRLTSILGKNYTEGSQEHKTQTELTQLVGFIEPSGYRPYVPSEETVEKLHDLVAQRFDSVLEHIDPAKTYEVADMVEALTTVVDKIGGTGLGWIVEVAKDSSALSTSAHQKKILVGENRRPSNGAELRTRSIHEVGIHALRSIIAERAGWLSAAYGHEDYLPFEEAMATALEDAYNGEFVEHGVDYYLIAGFGYGLDAHEPRNLRQVYEIMWRLNFLNKKDGSRGETEAVLKAKTKAFRACMRMFRGTSTKDKGVMYLKDLAYFNGQELAWSFLDTVQTQEDLGLAFAGKLDLTKADQLSVARDIMDKTKQ